MQVKEFHPDVRKDKGEADVMIRRVIQAYEASYSSYASCLSVYDF